MNIYAVILASGFSNRMQTNKLLIRYKDKCLVEYAMEAAKGASVTDSVVVTAYDAVESLCQKHNIITVRNFHPELGQSQSIILGTKYIWEKIKASGVHPRLETPHFAAALRPHGILFIPGDMPFLTSKDLQLLIKNFDLYPDKIIRPLYGDRPGSPVLFPEYFWEELMELTGDAGGREILKKYPDRVWTVPMPRECSGVDIDSPEAQKQWLI